MRTIERGIKRRAVIEAYAKYDCAKKGRLRPDFRTWNWLDADAIDGEMQRAGLKIGVPAGYLLWDKVEVTIPDLRECAVVDGIFPGKSRKLGLIELSNGLAGWKPNRAALWYDDIVQGRTFDESAPLMFRPAVKAEAPASWYVEDGSGRAIAFIANQIRFAPSRVLAIGFFGTRARSAELFYGTTSCGIIMSRRHTILLNRAAFVPIVSRSYCWVALCLDDNSRSF